MAHPLRKSDREAFDRIEPAEHQIDLTVQRTRSPAPAPGPYPAVENEREKGKYVNRLAIAGAASVVIVSVFTGTPFTGFALLIGTMVVRKALIVWGNWILDNTL